MVRLAMATNTMMATTASVVERPGTWARPAAAPAGGMRFCGFTAASRTANPNALGGETDSTVESHLGISGAASFAGRLRQLRRARARRRTPRAILPHDTESDAVLLVAATLPSWETT